MEVVQYGTRNISFAILRVDRKTLGIEVHPDLSVWAIAPENSKIDSIKSKIIKRAAWIVKQQNYFQQFLPRIPERQYEPGETHFYMGRRYVLKIRKGAKNEVKLKGSEIIILTNNEPSLNLIKNQLTSWYFVHAKRIFESKIEKSLLLLKKYKINNPEFEIRRMKNRWGSCTPNNKIILNPELIKAPGICIDYVIIHELCHLIYPDHSKEFYQLLSDICPTWQKIKNKLEKSMVV
jgi:predicted metal-dependent hydrolase